MRKYNRKLLEAVLVLLMIVGLTSAVVVMVHNESHPLNNVLQRARD